MATIHFCAQVSRRFLVEWTENDALTRVKSFSSYEAARRFAEAMEDAASAETLADLREHDTLLTVTSSEEAT